MVDHFSNWTGEAPTGDQFVKTVFKATFDTFI